MSCDGHNFKFVSFTPDVSCSVIPHFNEKIVHPFAKTTNVRAGPGIVVACTGLNSNNSEGCPSIA